MFDLISKLSFKGLFVSVITLSILACNGKWNSNADQKPIARVAEHFLYQEDITPLLTDGISKEDSISFVTNYINNWASKKLLLSKAKINLPKEELDGFEDLVANYREDLYTRAYKDALAEQNDDTLVTKGQMRDFYESEKMNFRLRERLVKIRFIQLPKQFLDKALVRKKLKNFNADDRVYLDSVSVHFKKFSFNDSIWVPVSSVLQEIPSLTLNNQNKYLKKSQFFELKDPLGVYLAQVSDVLKENDIAPLSYIEPTIKQVLLNRRKLDYIRKLETEVVDEAIKDKEFQVYAKED